ncbi:ABC transporter permease [Ilumatobacter nonamiensis]|uniref:ABC transporter permease n=1 Tax=Ilumatobacter nonamiensis TaxID=467093 RepID=UPI0003477393|nr:ABC transporter permease [Ilumatobacter nonamiensis]
MFFFILRRLLISIPILLASSVLMFFLVINSGDPLFDLRASTNPNVDQLIAARRQRLRLDDSAWERYWDWVTGLFAGDFGQNREGQNVSTLLWQAVQTTFRLVVLATILSIVIGIVFGIITAVRQYSVLDYSSTFAAFLFFSLPVFWVAVLLKEFGAIKFNDFLEAPGLSTTGIVLLTATGSFFVYGLVGGGRKRRLTAAAIAAAVQLVALVAIDRTDWMLNPGLSPLVIAILGAVVGVGAAAIFAPLSTTRVLLAALASVGVGLIGATLFQGWIEDPNWSKLLLLFLFTLGTGVGVGALVGGEVDRRLAMRAGAVSAFGVAAIILFDQFISAWGPGRTIGTVGPQTPNLTGTFWERMVDYAGHQILPSLALALIGFATFMRFTRSSMLDTMKSDYVRTAKAKGLPGNQVILRHAFRTALIPVMTVVTISFATVIEGAVITETVFGWKGMGQLFVEGLQNVDPYPVMGFMVVVSVSIVLLNAVADIMYAYLDPRIRR